MKKILPVVLIAGLLISCNDDRQKAAAEYCDCFRSKAKKFSPDFKRLMEKVAASKSPQKTLTREVGEMDEETQAAVGEEMASLQGLENDDVMKECEQRVGDFKVRGKNETERLKLVFEEMKKEKGCEILTGLLALGIEQQGKSGDDQTDVVSDEEEETPKKKKRKAVTEEEEL